MPRLLLLASIGCLFVVAGVQFGSSQETRTRNGVEAKPSAKPASGSGGFMVGTPVRYKNLTIFPVLSKAELNSDRFITLDEGLRAHSVEVLEMGAATESSRPSHSRGSNRPQPEGRSPSFNTIAAERSINKCAIGPSL